MRLFLIWLTFFLVSFQIKNAHAEPLKIGNLSSEYCLEDEEGFFWSQRTPPLVGYAKGEELYAGGDDNACVFGQVDARDGSAFMSINGRIVELIQEPEKEENVFSYFSKNKNIHVEVSITGSETTCEPNADKCCGDYTFSTIKISAGKSSKTIYAYSYSGG